MLKLFGAHVKIIASERNAMFHSKINHALFHRADFKRLLCGKTFHSDVSKYNSNKFLYTAFFHVIYSNPF